MSLFQIIRMIVCFLLSFKVIVICTNLMSRGNDIFFLAGILGIIVTLWAIVQTKCFTKFNFNFKKTNNQ
jgi:hypothetical protein